MCCPIGRIHDIKQRMRLPQTTEFVMSLKDQLDSLCAFFRRNDMEFGVIGAFALYLYGYVRATKDVVL